MWNEIMEYIHPELDNNNIDDEHAEARNLLLRQEQQH